VIAVPQAVAGAPASASARRHGHRRRWRHGRPPRPPARVRSGISSTVSVVSAVFVGGSVQPVPRVCFREPQWPEQVDYASWILEQANDGTASRIGRHPRFQKIGFADCGTEWTTLSGVRSTATTGRSERRLKGRPMRGAGRSEPVVRDAR